MPLLSKHTVQTVLSGHLKITIYISYKHALSLLLYYQVKYDGQKITEVVPVSTSTEIVPVSTCTEIVPVRHVHYHFILPLKCYNGSDIHRKTGPGSGVVSAG